MLYVVICLAMSMAAVAGLQFFYLAYIEKVMRQHKRRVGELERQNRVLYHRWQDAERTLTGFQNLEAEAVEIIEEEDVWAEIIEDDAHR